MYWPLAGVCLASLNCFRAHCLCVCACVCVSLPPRSLITSGMIWIPYDQLNKFYSFYMAAVVSNVSRHGFDIKVRHRNQPNKGKVGLHWSVTFTFNSCCAYVTKWSTLVIKVVVVWHVSRHLKEELAWTTIMLFKTIIYTSKELKNRAILSFQSIVCITTV